MKKYFLGAAMLVMGIVCLTSCGGDDEGSGNTINITDKDGNTVQVRKAGAVTFLYDNFNNFDGFMFNGNSYHLDTDKTLAFSYYDLFSGSDAHYLTNQFMIKINDRGLVSTTEFAVQFIISEDDEEEEYRINGKMVYGYNSGKQVTGMSAMVRTEQITREGGVKVGDKVGQLDIRHTATWKNGLLTDFEAKEKSSWTNSEQKDGRWEDWGWNEEKTTNGMVSYGSEANTAKQLPATLCDLAFYNLCIPMFGPICLYGPGPTHLPTSCTVYEKETASNGQVETDEETYTFHFTKNSDGTIASEWLDDDDPVQYQYSITRAIDDEQAQHMIVGLMRFLKLKLNIED